MEDSLNYSGALIFWMYIVAALAFTGIVLQTLYDLQRSQKPADNNRPTSIWLFSGLAFMSFCTLSYNMLNVLIQSFTLWCDGQMPEQLADYPMTTWQWSISSSLFRDFGEAIVANTAGFLWTQTALLVTLSISFSMAMKGKEHVVPKLWAFFCLSQILPISFAQNLFYVAVLLKPQKTSPTYSSKLWAVMAVSVYCSCLANAQLAAQTPWLIPTILAARLALVTPLKLARSEGTIRRPQPAQPANYLTEDGVQRVILMTSGVMTAIKAFQASQEGWSVDDTWKALFSHPAVSSLGYDLFFSLISSSFWRFLEPM